MLGAFGALVIGDFWLALLVVPIVLGLVGMVLERTLVRRLSTVDPLYNFLLTFGLTLVFQDLVKWRYGVQSTPYPTSDLLTTSVDFGLFDFPAYRVFVLAVAVAVCAVVWWLWSRTRLGMVVRASTDRPALTDALGINVGWWVTPVFGFGVALAGVLAAPMRAVNPLMGADLIIVVFAVVVIGGLGSIFGSVAAAFTVGVLQALNEAYLDSALISQIVVYVVMAVVLLWRPAGLLGEKRCETGSARARPLVPPLGCPTGCIRRSRWRERAAERAAGDRRQLLLLLRRAADCRVRTVGRVADWHSPFGRVLVAIRENPARARALGYAVHGTN